MIGPLEQPEFITEPEDGYFVKKRKEEHTNRGPDTAVRVISGLRNTKALHVGVEWRRQRVSVEAQRD